MNGMKPTSWKSISAALALVLLGCGRDVAGCDQVGSPTVGKAAAPVDTQAAAMPSDTGMAADTLQDSTRRKTAEEARRDRDLQRKQEFYRKWTPQQLDSMRVGEQRGNTLKKN